MPLLLLGALICLQAMLIACSLLFAQSAADRAARGAPRAQVLQSIPTGWRGRARITRTHERATVRVSPPVLIPGVRDRISVSASAERTS